ncbi:ATP cone domain-containing protein [Clostridium sp.]|uniref:ATP cone domain-containing protein n=1 Tax=Clostridium sp. TaxID=1506 RepID=UPI001A3F9033|nr:ATP cone domain-containing protein [Clostridium sp.]MBK5241373.1 ATPase [Clostridium sp.]
MKVVKQDGRLQSFDIQRIKTSIYSASDDANEPLNTSDIENLARSVESEIINLHKDTIQSYLIQSIVLSEIEKSGFHKVGKYYNRGKVE